MFDSEEESEIYMWLVEAEKAGIVYSFKYQPPSYDLISKKLYTFEKQLITKVKTITKTLFQPHIYTADFRVWFENEPPFKHFKNLDEFDDFVEMDVKPEFQNYDGSRSFSINRKLVYDKFGIYVHEIQPKKLFAETWRPAQAGLTKVHKTVQKSYQDFLTIDRYLQLQAL
jgi:hypothetical protein